MMLKSKGPFSVLPSRQPLIKSTRWLKNTQESDKIPADKYYSKEKCIKNLLTRAVEYPSTLANHDILIPITYNNSIATNNLSWEVRNKFRNIAITNKIN